MSDITDIIIVGVVIGARFIVPLFIPRFPLPAILIALVLDAADQTIFQQYTNSTLGLPTHVYQSYDKALDIYYLTIAYISTLHNWTNRFALNASRLLFFYRMVGVVLFELTGERFLLIVFPNTFEYFFIAYEAVRLRWNPRRFSPKQILGAIAAIWIGIKMPQEFIVHVAQIDTSDWLRETVYRAPPDLPFFSMLRSRPEITLPALAVMVVLAGVGVWLFRKLPPSDHALKFGGSPYAPGQDLPETSHALHPRIFFEKLFLLSCVTIIFAQLLPDADATSLQLAIGAALFIVINTVTSTWMAGRRGSPIDTLIEFAGLTLVNFGMLQILPWLLPNPLGTITVVNSLAFIVLLTLLTTLYDRYHTVYRWRFSPDTVIVSSSYVEQ